MLQWWNFNFSCFRHFLFWISIDYCYYLSQLWEQGLIIDMQYARLHCYYLLQIQKLTKLWIRLAQIFKKLHCKRLEPELAVGKYLFFFGNLLREIFWNCSIIKRNTHEFSRRYLVDICKHVQNFPAKHNWTFQTFIYCNNTDTFSFLNLMTNKQERRSFSMIISCGYMLGVQNWSLHVLLL